MRVVLDTNVLLSAVMFTHSVANALLKQLVARNEERIASKKIVEELAKVLRRDFSDMTEEAHRRAIRSAGLSVSMVTPVEVEHGTLRDKADLHVLGCVTAARADVLLTYDKDLLTLGTWDGARILTPDQLLRELRTDQHL